MMDVSEDLSRQRLRHRVRQLSFGLALGGLLPLAAAGQVAAQQPAGEAAAVEAKPAAADAAAPDLPLHERIDRVIESDHVGTPAPLAGDSEFLRRIYLDLTGRVPSIEATRAFLADASPDKRQRLVDQLLASPAFSRHMANLFDVMLMERRPDKHVKSGEWQAYLLAAIRGQKPLNELARELLAADGVEEALRPAVKFYLDRDGETNLLTRDVGRVFFGMDLQCAQCHDHPLIDDYFQADYYGIFAFLSRSFVFTDAKAKKSYFAEKAEGEVSFTSVFTSESGSTGPRLPGEQPLVEPTFEKDQEYLVKPAKDVRPVPKYSRRAQLAEHATSGANRAFNQNLANRLWALMLGRGLVDPVDLHHAANPPAHPELLRLLADELAAMKFDLRGFLRQLALTRAYQRSFDLPENLVQQAGEAGSRLAALEEQRAALVAAVEQARQAYTAAQQARSEANQALEPLQKPLADAAAALAAVVKDHQAAADKLAQLKTREALLADVGPSLALVADQADLAAKKLGDAAQLPALATTLRQRGEALASELRALEQSLPEQQALADAAAAKRSEAERQHAEIAARHAAASQQLAERQATLDASRAAVELAQSRLLLAERRIEQADRLVGLAQAGTARGEVQQRLAALGAELAQLESQLGAVTDPAAGEPATSEALRQQAEALVARRDSVQAELDAEDARHDELLSGLTDDWGRRFVIATLKPLRPEQLAWSLMEATGQVQRNRTAAEAELNKKQPLPADAAAVAQRQELLEADLQTRLSSQVSAFVQLFGAGAGQPQDDFFATVDQALFFSNGGQVRGWLAPSAGNLTDRLGKLEDPAAVAEELYLSVLTRQPSAQEIDDVGRQLAARPQERPAVIQDLAWALLTSAEFRFNH